MFNRISSVFPVRRHCAVMSKKGVMLLVAFGVICLMLHQLMTRFSSKEVETDSFHGKEPKDDTHSCKGIITGDVKEQNKALRYTKDNSLSDDYYNSMTSCKTFIEERKYITSPSSKEEANFPIAYSILVFKDVGQFERLLRAIYRPQNAYCIHIDLKTDDRVKKAFTNIASCLPNVFVSDRSVDVKWGRYSVLAADLICMKELLAKYKTWKYLINLTGQEFPLRTNWELVRILKVFNGANSMEGTVKRSNIERIPKKHPGFNVTWVKGSVHITVSRAFVKFMFNDQKAIRLLDILQKQEVSNILSVPDEQFFATLNHNPQLGTPGAYLGEPETHTTDYPFITRLKNWGDGPFNYPCLSGTRVHRVCIWGVKDLPFITKRPELFVNKFYSNFQPAALNCLEEWLWDKIENEMNNNYPAIELSYYKSLSFVKHHQ